MAHKPRLPSELRDLLRRAAQAVVDDPGLAAELREAAEQPIPVAGRAEAVREVAIARARLRESQLREARLQEAMRVTIDRLDHPDLAGYDPADPNRTHFRTVSRAVSVLEQALGLEPRWKDSP